MTGGELFIPKIPSMKITDLAEAIGPGCALKEIGIRPGEKMHEVLLPRDESRHAIEFAGHFTLEPAFSWWRREEHLVDGSEIGRPVPEDFEYSSDNNTNWLDHDDILELIGEKRQPAAMRLIG